MPHDVPPEHTGGHPQSAAHEHAHLARSAALPGSMADASVRLARATDTAAVGHVQAQVWRAAYGSLLSPEMLQRLDPAAFARVWRDSLSAPPSRRHALLVACAGEQVVGFVAVGPSDDPDATESVGELLGLGVHPDARREGHGSRLLNAAVDTLRGREFAAMVAWLLATDEEARAFLVGAGMSPDGAFRDRVVDADGSTAREVRLVADLGPV